MQLTTKLLLISLFACLFMVTAYSVGSFASAANVSCSGGTCWYTQCKQNSDCGINHWTGAQSCSGNNVIQDYATYTCNGAGTADAYCTTTITSRNQTSCSSGQMCKRGMCTDGGPSAGATPTPTTCTSHNYTQCSNGAVYWFDSCNNKQDVYQTCSVSQTCSGNTCKATYTSHVFKGCVLNTSYWYDSLGNQQDAYQHCSLTGQTCQNGSCVGAIYTSTPAPTPTPTPNTTYVQHSATKCYNDEIRWFDSRGVLQDLYKSCTDDNSCTADTCADGACKNELTCDGSTCAAASADYIKYCASTAAVSQNPLLNFLKNWYLWIIIAIVLIFLFIMVFRRLSSNA